jgi:transposase
MKPEKDGYLKVYQDKEWLALQLKTHSVRQIAKYCHVSYKLINKWGLTHGLIRNTPDVKLP